MSVPEVRYKRKYRHAIKMVAVICGLIGLAVTSFGLGRLSGIQETRTPVTISRTSRTDSRPSSSLLVGSEHSDKYHYPWCPGAQRIKASNRITFRSQGDARREGYSAADNCPGLTPTTR